MTYKEAVKEKERLQPEHTDGALFVCPLSRLDRENYLSKIQGYFNNGELTDEVAIIFSTNGKFSIVKLINYIDTLGTFEFLDIE